MSANCWCFSVNTREVNQPPQTLTLRAAHDQVFRLTPFGMKDSRTKRSPPVLPPLASTQLPHGPQPPCLGFPHAFLACPHLPGSLRCCQWCPRSWLCFGLGTGGSLVRNRLGSPIRVPTLSGNRRSAHKQGLGFPPLKRLGARASCPSALSAGLPLAPYKQAALSLVRTPTCRDQELSSNKICTGRPLGGHVPTLLFSRWTLVVPRSARTPGG